MEFPSGVSLQGGIDLGGFWEKRNFYFFGDCDPVGGPGGIDFFCYFEQFREK